MDTDDLRWTKLTNHERRSLLMRLKAAAELDADPVAAEAAIEALQAVHETP